MFSFFISIVLFFYSRFLCLLFLSVPPPPPPPPTDLLEHYPEDIILKIGKLEFPGRKDHFLNFSHEKPPGTIRIGTFGDSFVYGADVEESSSYPRHLQNKLTERFPNRKIEVLNFGVPGHGFQEQFFLWEKYSQQYGLDYILIGPRWFHPDRSATFRKNWGFEKKKPLYYPHERFILSNNDTLKRVHIKGHTLEERYRNYYKLVPSWTALRYDIKPFFILENFLRLKPHENPFYYYKEKGREWGQRQLDYGSIIKKERFSMNEISTTYYDPMIGEETAKINILLLEKIKELYHKKIMVLIDNLVLTEYRDTDYYRSFEKDYNINWTDYPYEWQSLYRSFGHYSSLGYELPAIYFFNALIGKEHFVWKKIKCFFKKKNYKINKRNINLSEVNSIKLTGGYVSLCDFRLKDDKHYFQEMNYQIDHSTQSFLTFSSRKSDDFGNAIYHSLPIQLKEGMKVYIQFSDQSKTELGEIHAFDSHGKFFDFYAKYISYYPFYQEHEEYFIFDKMPSFLQEKIAQASTLALFVEDYQLGTLQWYYPEKYKNKKLKLELYSKARFYPSGPDHYVTEKDVPDRFPLYIQYTMNNGKIFKNRVQNWNCFKERRKVRLNISNFEPL